MIHNNKDISSSCISEDGDNNSVRTHDGRNKCKLLRLSDFCYQKPSFVISNRLSTASASSPNDATNCPSYWGARNRVQLSILQISPHVHNSNDEFSMVYVSDVDTLIEWGIMDGAVCWLISSTTATTKQQRQVPVRIQIMVEPPLLSSHPLKSSSYEHPLLYIPPCIAASIGFDANNNSDTSFYDLTPMHPTTSWNNPSVFPIANEVTLQEIGVSPYDLIRHDNTNTTTANNNKSEGDDPTHHIQQYFHRKPRLLSQYCLVGIDNRSKKLTRKTKDTMKFYQIIRHVIASDATKTILQQQEAFMVTQQTRLVLFQKLTLSEDPKQQYTTTSVRLPSIIHAQSFYQSVMKDSIASTITSALETTSAPLCRTKLNNLIDFLWYSTTTSTGTSSTTTTTLSRCIHVHINDDDYDNLFVDVDGLLSKYIKSATDTVGMRCLTVDGLAAFHYRYSNNPKQQSTNIVAEKIFGLQKALSICQQVKCILHICNFHEEFFHHHQDHYDDVNQDIVDRIQTCLDETSKSCSSFTVPIIFSSSSKYQQPNRFSAFPSIPLSFLPNETEIQTFWRNQLLFPTSSNHLVGEQVKTLLLGRNEQEILTACQRLIEKWNLLSNDCCSVGEGAITSTLSSILNEIDAKKKHATNSTRNINNNMTIIPSIHWEDIGGLSNVKNEIRNAIEIPLKYPHLFPTNDLKRSGIVLFGPPGTGKTLVAKAVATECGLPFISIKGPELLGSYVGESEANVRKAFETARTQAAAAVAYQKATKTKAAILFFDELDSLAPRRRIDVAGNNSSSSDVMDRVVATLLGELDQKMTSEAAIGDEDSQIQIFVIGATNRPDLLDPALLRPGRLDRRVYLGFPTNEEDRIQILKSQMQKFPFGDSVAEADIRSIIHCIPPNLTGADLSAISSGALLRSLHRKCKEIEQEAQKRIMMGDNIAADAYETCIQQVMEEWEEKDETLLTPIVTLDDITESSKCIVPSVSLEDRKKYEALHKTFSS
jgi:SpoVK/Ycf46/Vps4 family AAA+-type ATPase